MANVNDVAAYILEKSNTMSTMKLQKLVYYCQTWSLVWDEKPLFDSRIEAWANEPVTVELFKEHKGRFTARKDMFPGQPSRLAEPEKPPSMRFLMRTGSSQANSSATSPTASVRGRRLGKD